MVQELLEGNQKVQSGEITALMNLLVNFDKDVISLLVEDEDVDNYTRVLVDIVDMQNTILGHYYNLYPEFRQMADKIDAEYIKEEGK